MNWMRRRKQTNSSPVAEDILDPTVPLVSEQGPYRTAPLVQTKSFAEQMKDLAISSHPDKVKEIVEKVKEKIVPIAEKGGFNFSYNPDFPKDSITIKMLIEALRREGLRCVFKYPNLSTSSDLEISWDKS